MYDYVNRPEYAWEGWVEVGDRPGNEVNDMGRSILDQYYFVTIHQIFSHIFNSGPGSLFRELF